MNMSYCRFQNTLGDLRDCYEAWDKYADRDDDSDDDAYLDMDVLSEDERDAREQLLALCKKIVFEFAEE